MKMHNMSFRRKRLKKKIWKGLNHIQNLCIYGHKLILPRDSKSRFSGLCRNSS